MNQVRTLLNNVNTSIQNMVSPSSSASSTTTTSTTSTTSTSPNTVESLGGFLNQLDSSFTQIHPSLSRLSSLLQQESTLATQQERTEAQQLSVHLGSILQQLGVLSIILSSSVSSLQMGNAPGTARAESPGSQQRHVLSPTGNISIHIQNDVGVPIAPSQNPPNQNGPTPIRSPISVNMPLFTVSPRNTNAQQPQVPPQPQQTQQQQPGMPQPPMMAAVSITFVRSS